MFDILHCDWTLETRARTENSHTHIHMASRLVARVEDILMGWTDSFVADRIFFSEDTGPYACISVFY